MYLLRVLLLFIRGVLRSRTELALENLALRQQLAALRRQSKRPRLKKCDRNLLGSPISDLGELAFRSSHCAARHRSRLAPQGIQAVLAMEIPKGQSRTAEDRSRDSQVDSSQVT